MPLLLSSTFYQLIWLPQASYGWLLAAIELKVYVSWQLKAVNSLKFLFVFQAYFNHFTRSLKEQSASMHYKEILAPLRLFQGLPSFKDASSKTQ